MNSRRNICGAIEGQLDSLSAITARNPTSREPSFPLLSFPFNSLFESLTQLSLLLVALVKSSW